MSWILLLFYWQMYYFFLHCFQGGNLVQKTTKNQHLHVSFLFSFSFAEIDSTWHDYNMMIIISRIQLFKTMVSKKWKKKTKEKEKEKGKRKKEKNVLKKAGNTRYEWLFEDFIHEPRGERKMQWRRLGGFFLKKAMAGSFFPFSFFPFSFYFFLFFQESRRKNEKLKENRTKGNGKKDW